MKRSTGFRLPAAVAMAAVALVGLAGCGSSGASDYEETSISIGVTSLSSEYNPGRGYMYASLNMNGVYDSLLHSNAEGGLDPWLASEWEQSDDRKVASFTLREDVDFVDGTHLTAKGVVSFFDTLLATEDYWGLPQLRDQYQAEFKVTGEYTFEVATALPMPMSLISGYGAIQPIGSAEGIRDPEAISKEPVGSGPYLLGEFVPDVSLTLVRNPDYWNPEAYPFDTVKLLVFADNVAALNALKTGQIDGSEVSIANAAEAEAEGFTISAAPGRNVVLWFADRAGTIQPAIADVRVRQAINHAFDREQINETLNRGYGVVTSQPWSPVDPEYSEANDDYYTYDLDRAKELMAEAGYADGFELTIPTTTFLGIDLYGPIVQQTLSEIGITVTYDVEPDISAYFERARDGSYPVLLYNEAFVNTVPNFVAADGFWNYLGYVDPDVEELVQEHRFGTLEESAEASAEIADYILEEAWLAPISAPFNLYATAPGFAVDLNGAFLHNFRQAD